MTNHDDFSSYVDSKGRRPYLPCDPRYIEYRPQDDEIRSRLGQEVVGGDGLEQEIITRLADISMRYGVDAHDLPETSLHLWTIVILSKIVRGTGAMQRHIGFSDLRQEVDQMDIDSVVRLTGTLKDMEELVQLMACVNQVEFLARVLDVGGPASLAKAIEITRPHMASLAPDNRAIIEDYIEKCGPARS